MHSATISPRCCTLTLHSAFAADARGAELAGSDGCLAAGRVKNEFNHFRPDRGRLAMGAFAADAFILPELLFSACGIIRDAVRGRNNDRQRLESAYSSRATPDLACLNRVCSGSLAMEI